MDAPDLADRGKTDPPAESTQTEGSPGYKTCCALQWGPGTVQNEETSKNSPSGRSSCLSACGTFSRENLPLRPAGFLAVMNLHGIFLCLAYIFGILRSLPLTIWSK